MARRSFGVLAALLVGVVLAVMVGTPAGAQYQPEGNFTVNPANIIQGNNTTVEGWCEAGESIEILLDGTTSLYVGVVPGINDDDDFLVTTFVSIVVTIPVATPPGPHTLHVVCHNDLIQILNINVLSPVCQTGGVVLPPLGGVYGIYSGDPAGGQPPTRTPPPGATIYGTVTSLTSGLPMPNVTVRAMRPDNTFAGPATQTDANGYYAFNSQYIKPGYQYKIRFVEIGFVTFTSGLQLFNGTPIQINHAMVSAANAPGVSGTVTDSVTGQPLAGVYVRIWVFGTIGRYIATTTNASGQYSFVGIPEGEYQIQFASPGYATQWFSASGDRLTSTPFSVSGVGAVTVNAVVTGSCAGNGVLLSGLAEQTSDGMSAGLATGGVLLMVAGGQLVLAHSKRRRRLVRTA